MVCLKRDEQIALNFALGLLTDAYKAGFHAKPGTRNVYVRGSQEHVVWTFGRRTRQALRDVRKPLGVRLPLDAPVGRKE